MQRGRATKNKLTPLLSRSGDRCLWPHNDSSTVTARPILSAMPLPGRHRKNNASAQPRPPRRILHHCLHCCHHQLTSSWPLPWSRPSHDLVCHGCRFERDLVHGESWPDYDLVKKKSTQKTRRIRRGLKGNLQEESSPLPFRSKHQHQSNKQNMPTLQTLPIRLLHRKKRNDTHPKELVGEDAEV